MARTEMNYEEYCPTQLLLALEGRASNMGRRQDKGRDKLKSLKSEQELPTFIRTNTSEFSVCTTKLTMPNSAIYEPNEEN